VSSVELKSQVLNIEAVLTEDFAALHDSSIVSLVVCRDTAWADTRCKSSVSLTSDACYCRLGIESVAVLHNSSFSLVHHPDAACMITKQESSLEVDAISFVTAGAEIATGAALVGGGVITGVAARKICSCPALKQQHWYAGLYCGLHQKRV